MKTNKNLILIKLEINITFIILSIFSIIKVFYEKNTFLNYILFSFSIIFLILILFTAYFHNPKRKIEIEIKEKIRNFEKILFILSNVLFILVIFVLIVINSPYFLFYDNKFNLNDNNFLKILSLIISGMLILTASINLIIESIIINKILNIK